MFRNFNLFCNQGHISCLRLFHSVYRNLFSLLLGLGLGLGLARPACILARPLTEAHVTKIVNIVRLSDPAFGERPARINDVVRDEIAVTTGIKSRSELLFQDNTLARLGPESYFSFKGGTRDLTLQKGTMLLQIPKRIGGAKIHTAAITAAITGTTIMMEYIPGKDIKVVVLEGSLRLSVNHTFGDSLLLGPGQMVIMSPNAKHIPDPVTIDLKKLVRTSTLVNMPSGKHQKQANLNTPPLPSMSLIEKEIERQESGKDAHHLVDTNLVILGKGTNVLLGSDNLMAQLRTRNDVAKIEADLAQSNSAATPAATPAVTATPAPTPDINPTPNPNPPPVGTPTPPPPGSYTIDNTTRVTTQTNSATITTQGTTSSGVVYKNVQNNGSPSAFLFGATSLFDDELNFDNLYTQQIGQSGVFTFDSLQLGGGMSFSLNGGTNDIAFVGDSGITNAPGTVVNLGGIQNILFATQAGNITLDSGISFQPSSDFTKPNFVLFYARGGDANIGATFNLPHTSLQFAAEDNAIFGGTASITAKNLTITGLQSVQFGGSANASSLFQLNGGDVQMTGSATANTAYLFGSSATIDGMLSAQNLSADVSGDFTLNNAGQLASSSGSPLSITAGGNLTLDGTVTAQKLALTAASDLSIGGTVTTSDAFTATAGTATINGGLGVRQATFQTSGDFLLGVTGNLTSSGDVTINASGGGITLNGPFSGHNVTLTATGNIAIDHAIASSQLDITGGSVSFGADQTVTGSGNELTATSGNIDATGHQLTGFDQITLTNANLVAAGIAANSIVINGTGNITVANNLTLAKPLTVAGAVNVGGLLSDQTITTGDITVNALQTNTLTSSGVFTLNSASLTPFGSNTVTITAPTVSFVAGATLNGQNGTPTTGPGNAYNLTVNTGTFDLEAPLNLNGGDGDPSRNDGGGNGGQLNLTSSDSITLNAPISATTGQNSQNGVNGGNGGTVNLTANNTITLNDTIQVSSNSGKRVSHNAGNINVTSNKASGTAIAVNSSAQILALLNATAGGGGSIKFVSAGGDINVTGATMEADKGTIDIHNNGATGAVALNNATLNASTVKVGALGNNGTLTIGGGTISADSLIRLYAGGSNGTIDFTDNVTLSGNSVKQIAANTVTIFNGKIVTINGLAPASVFTNNPNYTGFGGNGSTTGTFGGQGATTQPLANAPGY
jgi:FecR protein